MAFIHIATMRYPLSAADIIAENPRTSFPIPFAPPDGYAWVHDVDPPAHDQRTHKAVQLPPAEQGGQWQQQWGVVQLTQQEIDDARRAAVPAKVTRRQARQALLISGLLDAVQPAISAIPDPVQRGLAQIEWDDSQDFERDRPLLIQLGYAIGLDDAGIDNLFINAGAL